MSEHTVYPNILWCVENLTENMKKRGPIVRLLESHWKLKTVVYPSVEGKKVQLFLTREAPPQYCVNTYFYAITSACIDDGKRYLKKYMKIKTTSTKNCIWEAYHEEMIKLSLHFKCRVNFFISFEPGSDWRNYQGFKDNAKSDTSVSYSIPVLCQDFEKLLTEGVYADVVLRCEGKDFPAHKSILSVRSQGFRNIFSDSKIEEMREKDAQVLEITDIGAEALMHMLRYIYLGEMPAEKSPTAQEIYNAIQKYNVGCWSSSSN